LSYGYSFASIDERVERLKETVLILKAMWTEEQVSFHGKYNKLLNAINYPKPVQKPHPPIWIGGKHVRILDIIAEMGDGWNYWGLKRKMLTQRSEYLFDKCARIGRDPDQITKSWAGTLSHLPKQGGDQNQIVENIRDQLRSQTDHETRYFIASLGAGADTSSYEAFAEAVSSLE
jgi:hypothetical protein